MVSIAKLKSLPLPMILHAAAFASNSFVVWEDRIITFLLLSTLIPSVLSGLSAPTSRLRYRILGFSGLFAACIRLMAVSTVCREEQQPNCHVTFYASASLTAPPLPILILSIPTALALPWLIRRFLRISQSDKGVAGLFLPALGRDALDIAREHEQVDVECMLEDHLGLLSAYDVSEETDSDSDSYEPQRGLNIWVNKKRFRNQAPLDDVGKYLL